MGVPITFEPDFPIGFLRQIPISVPVDAAATGIAAPGPATAAVEPNSISADPGELAALRSGNADLREELDKLKASFAETLADNESMGRVFDTDDQLKAAMDENKRLRAVSDSAERVVGVGSPVPFAG